MLPPRILVIAGSDSGGGAGIQADIKTITRLGGHAMTAVTAITAQNSRGVAAVMPIAPEMVVAQMDAVASDLGIDAIKIGMLGSADTADWVADWLEDVDRRAPVIVDPVMVATTGAVLADRETVAALGRIFDLARLITPNAPELAALTGLPVRTPDEAAAAATLLARRHGAAVLAKGGHLDGASLVDQRVTAEGDVRRWSDPRIDTVHSHGTGCTLASGIATRVGGGASLDEAIGVARAFVRACLCAAPGYGHGHGPMGHAMAEWPPRG